MERDDLPRFVEWSHDPEVLRHLALAFPLGLAGEERWFEAQLKLDPACQPFAIDVRGLRGGRSTAGEGWTHVGAIGFHQVDWRNRTAELGVMIGRKDAWGLGFGTDATRALVSWGFGVLNLNRVSLRVFEDNARGIRCYEKVGFRHEGRLRQDRFHSGRYWDTLVMGVLRAEFGTMPARERRPAAAARRPRAPKRPARTPYGRR